MGPQNEPAMVADPGMVKAHPRPEGGAPSTADELDELGRLLSVLEENLDRMAERFGPVLRPSAPQPGMLASTRDASFTSPLADRLHSMVTHADTLAARTRDLLSRIDL